MREILKFAVDNPNSKVLVACNDSGRAKEVFEMYNELPPKSYKSILLQSVYLDNGSVIKISVFSNHDDWRKIWCSEFDKIEYVGSFDLELYNKIQSRLKPRR